MSDNNGKNNTGSSQKRGTAPFNFVRLPKVTFDRYQTVQELPRHDCIYREEDGYYSGEITYDVVVDGNDSSSALIIGQDVLKKEEKNKGKNNKDSIRHFFRNNDGMCTIPGSTMRGLIRNNVQILGMCNPKADIANTRFMYRAMADATSDRKTVYLEKVNAGSGVYDDNAVQAGYIVKEWDNKKHEECYVIYPSVHETGYSYYRIPERNLRDMMQDSTNCKDSTPIQFMYTDEDCTRINRRFHAYYADNVKYTTDSNGQVRSITFQPDSDHTGTLMSSGYIGSENNLKRSKKTHYLIPEIDWTGAAIVLDDADVRSYLDDLNRKKNVLKDKDGFYSLPERIGDKKPVFFQRIDGRMNFGMTPYLRIFYERSVHDGISKELDTDGIDYADAMFGMKSDTKSKVTGYKARVAFADAVSKDARIGKATKLLLAEPKPTYAPEYLRSKGEKPSYADDEIEIKGIKQYWLVDQLKDGTNAAVTNENVYVNVEPVTSGTFSGKIYFNNLAKDELGLLLYAIYIRKDAYQSIGMGKPYGYGKVRIKNLHAYTYDFRNLYESISGSSYQEMDVEATIDCYKEYMETFLAGTGSKEKTKSAAKSEDASHWKIDAETNVREFIYIKTKIMNAEDTAYMTLDGGFKNNIELELMPVTHYMTRDEKANKKKAKEAAALKKQQDENQKNKKSGKGKDKGQGKPKTLKGLAALGNANH